MKTHDCIECPSEKVKNICHEILDNYYYEDEDDDYEIGENDIESFLDSKLVEKYAPHLNDEEIQALWNYMRKIVNVVPGYAWETDPDDIWDDPRWDD